MNVKKQLTILLATNLVTMLVCYFLFTRNDNNNARAGNQNAGDVAYSPQASPQRNFETRRPGISGSGSAHTDQKIDPTKDHTAPFSLVNQQGKITTKAAEEAGLSIEERLRAQSAIDAAWEQAGAQTGARAILEPDTDFEKGIAKYFIPAAPDRGASLLESLKSSLEEAVGHQKAELLFSTFDPTVAFGGFGRYDVSIAFHESHPDQPDDKTRHVRFLYNDPESGRTTLTAEMRFEAYRELFGDSFLITEGD